MERTDWKIPTRCRKIWSQNWKSKSRRRQNVVEKSQSESKTFDAINVGHYAHTMWISIFPSEFRYLAIAGEVGFHVFWIEFR